MILKKLRQAFGDPHGDPPGDTAADADAGSDRITFGPVGHYQPPKMPTVHVLRRYLRLLRQKLGQDEAGPVLTENRLTRTTPARLDDIVAPPAHASLLDELDRTLDPWCDDPQPANWLQVVVLPPGDRSGLLDAWARRHRHEVLSVPSRAQLLAGHVDALKQLQGDGVLVVPRLERWFLRHRNGLQALRSLLIGIGQLQRHCVIGCNSWAWAYLSRALAVNRMLPTALTFQAFDAERLRHWFQDLARSDGSPTITFRLAANGNDALAHPGDDGGNDTLKRLAARSLGIPWVAWHLWRQSLRTQLDSDEVSQKVSTQIQQATNGDARTLWVTGFKELSLPPTQQDDALLVLHALLLHGELTAAELRAVLPNVSEVDSVPALMHAGFVAREGDDFHVRATAYPPTRTALEAAGYPLDRL